MSFSIPSYNGLYSSIFHKQLQNKLTETFEEFSKIIPQSEVSDEQKKSPIFVNDLSTASNPI